MPIKLREHIFKVGDLVMLQNKYQEKLANHKQVFQLYSPLGAPREWICQLVGQDLMRIEAIEHNIENVPVVVLRNDPCDQRWHEDWFEAVAEENFTDQEDLFTL